MSVKTIVWASISAMILLVLMVLGLASFYTVPYGHVAIVTRFGEIVGDVQNPGLHFKVPLVDHVIVYNTQKIIYETLDPSLELYENSKADYQDYAVDTTTKDGQQINIRYTIRFSLDPNKIRDIAERIGKESDVIEKIVKTDSRIWVRNIPREYSAIDLYTGNIDHVSVAIQEKLQPIFEANGLILDEFGIRTIHFNDDYVSAIETKQIEKENIATEQYRAEQEKYRKQAAVTKAEGEAAAQKLQHSTLTPDLIKKLYIEKWDGKLPNTMCGQDSNLLLNLK